MTQEVFLGRAPILPSMPSTASGWHGLCLHSTGAATFTTFDHITFAAVFAETDGIRTTGSEGPFAGVTIAAGSAGKVPAGMAGYWRLACQSEFSRDTAETVEMDLAINGSLVVSSSHDSGGADLFPDLLHIAIAPIVYELAEGDVVWVNVLPTGGDVGAGFDATLLMEYLGPVTEVS